MKLSGRNIQERCFNLRKDKFLGTFDAVVVGCGPTGISALYECAKLGLTALGIDQGRSPLDSVRNYLDGLPVVSKPNHYEVGGLPLDCRDMEYVTREELLHYYSRIINTRLFGVRAHTQCIALEPISPGKIRVAVELKSETKKTRGYFLAKNVIVTSWYRRRSKSNLNVAKKTRVQIFCEMVNPIEVAGQKVAILGGGLSALEQASALMLSGHTMTLLSRRVISPSKKFSKLVKATDSRIIKDANQIKIERGGLSYFKKHKKFQLKVDSLVLCSGFELDPGILKVLKRAKVLSQKEIIQLIDVDKASNDISKFKQVVSGPNTKGEFDEGLVLSGWPDFTRQVFDGVNGIYLAGGGVLFKGGVAFSIYTAKLAARSILGKREWYPKESLPVELNVKKYLELTREKRSLDFSDIKDLRPFAINNWSRQILSFQSSALDLGHFLVYPVKGERDFALKVLKLSDGNRSVSQIMRHLGYKSENDRKAFIIGIRNLWWSNALTWLPAKLRSKSNFREK